MADTYVLPALPQRLFAARRNSQFMSGATLVGFGTIATGTFMATGFITVAVLNALGLGW